jgi:hypothetical protein
MHDSGNPATGPARSLGIASGQALAVYCGNRESV